MEILIPVLFTVTLFIAVVHCNIQYRKERALLTPEERAEEDEWLIHQGHVY